MQLHIDLTNQPAEYGKRVIAMIEAFYGLPQTGSVTLSQMKEIAATVPSVPEIAAHFKVPTNPQPQAAASAHFTVAAAPSSTVPVEPQASSPEPSVPPVPAAPTAPVATAPTAPAAPTSPVGIELDTDGLPWDARIHSSSKAKNADGRWRVKKGLNDGTLVARIQAELRAAMAVPAAPRKIWLHHPESCCVFEGTEADLAGDGGLVVEVSAEQAAALQAQYAQAAPEVPAAATPFVPPPPPATAAVAQPAAVSGATAIAGTALHGPNPTTLPELMPLVTSAMIAGKVKPTALLESLPEGIADLPTLAQRPDLIPAVWAALKATYPGAWA